MSLGEGYFCGLECRDRWHDAHPERDHGARGNSLPSCEAASASHGPLAGAPGAAAAPEGDDPAPDLLYIVPRPLHGKHGKALGKIHTVDPTDISRSLCGWRFTKFADNEGHIFSTTPHPSENVAIEGALRCSTCSRCEEQLSL